MFKQIILIGAVTFVISTLLMWAFQRQLIYYPSREIPRLIDYQANDMRVVLLHTQDGLVLNSWYKPADARQPTIIYLHGNAGNIGGSMPLVRQLIHAGLGVLLLEYRGYGGNPGHPTEQGLYEDGRAGIRFLNQHGVASDRIIVYGESLGSGVATQLAIENKIGALILQSPYTSICDMARYHYPWLLIKPLDRFESIKRIQQINAPLLILHSMNDEVVPYSQGLALFQRAIEPKKMLAFKTENHNNLWNSPGFSEKISDFIIHYWRPSKTRAFSNG